MQQAVGPVKKKKSKMPALERFKLILESLKCQTSTSEASSGSNRLFLLIGRPGSGIPDISRTLHRTHGVFVFEDNDLTEANKVIYGLTNLSNCAVTLSDFNMDNSFKQSELK